MCLYRIEGLDNHQNNRVCTNVFTHTSTLQENFPVITLLWQRARFLIVPSLCNVTWSARLGHYNALTSQQSAFFFSFCLFEKALFRVVFALFYGLFVFEDFLSQSYFKVRTLPALRAQCVVGCAVVLFEHITRVISVNGKFEVTIDEAWIVHSIYSRWRDQSDYGFLLQISVGLHCWRFELTFKALFSIQGSRFKWRYKVTEQWKITMITRVVIAM